MSTSEPQPSEEELRAAYEAEIKRIRVEHVLLEHVVTLINLGMRRTGLAPGTEDERDPAQVHIAIEAIRSALPLLDQAAPQQIGPIREALSQLQLAYVKIGGPSPGGEADPAAGAGAGAAPRAEGAQAAPAPGAGAPPGATAPGASPPEDPGGPGPAQRSGRLWIPDR